MERLFAGRRLVHAFEAKTDKPIPVIEVRMRSQGSKPAEPVEVQVGELNPDVLKKIRAKAIFSIRDDLIKEDRKKNCTNYFRRGSIIMGKEKLRHREAHSSRELVRRIQSGIDRVRSQRRIDDTYKSEQDPPGVDMASFYPEGKDTEIVLFDIKRHS